MGETTKEARIRWAKEDYLMTGFKKNGKWPSNTCNEPRCKAGSCCLYYHHHIGGCCTHCGNDERDLSNV